MSAVESYFISYVEADQREAAQAIIALIEETKRLRQALTELLPLAREDRERIEYEWGTERGDSEKQRILSSAQNALEHEPPILQTDVPPADVRSDE